jgi:uncharacterized membrane protein YqjE
VSTEPSSPQGPSNDQPQNIAAAIAEVSERATQLVREEIELAKAEVAEKTSKLIRGALVGAVAGVFVLMALIFALVGCAWLLYYYLPGNEFTYFWGFFALAAGLLVLGVLAGLIAAKAVKKGAPPVPNMAIEEARKIRETVSGEDASGVNASAASATAAAAGEAPAEPGDSVHEAVATYTAAGTGGAAEDKG